MRCAPHLALTLVLLTAAADALAAPTEQERVLANVLFQEAKQLVLEGRYDEACPKFEESHRLQPGGGTLLNLGMCHEQAGRHASAWGELQSALSIARRDGREDRAKLALERIQVIEATLSYLTVSVPDAVKVPGLRIEVDGVELPPAAWQTAQPINQGRHELTASAPGHASWTTPISIDVPRQRAMIAIPSLTPGQDRKAAAPSGLHGQELGGIVAAAIGGTAAGFGVGFGAAAIDRWSAAEAECPTPTTCTSDGSQAAANAARFADISTVLFVTAGTAVALGAVLWFTAPGRSASDHVGSAARWRVELGPTGGRAVVEASF